MADADFTDVNMIAFRRMNQMDISGNVVTQSEFLPTLKVMGAPSNFTKSIFLRPVDGI